MKFALAVTTVLAMGCGIDTAAPDPGAGDPNNPADPGDGTGPVTEVAGHITASTTWSGTIHVVTSTVIDAGATVTVMPGTTVDVGSGLTVLVSGVLDIQGTRASKVVFRSADPAEYWIGIAVRGGTMTASYLVEVGGGLNIVTGGKVTLVDSHLSHTGGDLLVMAGGTLDMTYSEIGLASGQDTTHCNLHVTGAPTITVAHSTISAARYGIMLYGGSSADFRYTNWFGNGIDISTEAAYPVTADLSNSYFARGAPTYVGFTRQNMASAVVGDAGVR
jgi:hypothetical protein